MKNELTTTPPLTDAEQEFFAQYERQMTESRISEPRHIEVRCVDNGGLPERKHMRCDADLHPWFAHMPGNTKYPTRYKGGVLTDHDDWSCLDDCELVGLLENKGTGLNRVYKLTALGRLVASQLRQHKQDGGNFHSFVPRI